MVGEGTTAADGTFSIGLAASAVAPYTLKLAADEISLYAIYPSSTSGVVNITPLSDAVVAMVSPNGTPVGLVSAVQAGASAPSASTVLSKQQVVSEALKPLASAVGLSGSVNVFDTAFNANGAGIDKMLDTVAVASNADGTRNTANIQLVVKVATNPEDPTAQMPSLNLTSASTVSDATAEGRKLGTISATELPPNNAAALYADLIAQLNACYRDAPNVRTDGSSVVRSDACKKVFLDNDPTQYLNYGQRLGANAQFAGLFTYPGAVEFKPVAKPYLVQDLAGVKSNDGKGRAIVAMSWVNEHGNRENIMLYATKYRLEGKELLGLSGDRNQYGWSVVSHNQKREFPLRADRSLDYVQSQYLISVRDLFQNGKSVINYVTVTSPTGKKILLASALGGASRDLAICRSNEVQLDSNKQPVRPTPTETTTYGPAQPKYHCTGTSKSLTFAQSFVDPSARSRVPSDIGNAGILRPLDSNGQPYTPDSATLAAYPSIGMWTIEYVFMNNTTKTQKTWSVARPMTVEELMGPDGPDAVMGRYTDAAVAALKALKTQRGNLLTACYSGDPTCDPFQAPVPAPLSGGYNLAWTEGRVPMTSLWISGSRNQDNPSTTWISSANATRWDDQLNVRSTARQAELQCSRQSDPDNHCAGNVAVNGLGGFNPRSWMTYSELWGKDAEQRSMMRSYNWYQPRKSDNTPF